MFAAFRVQAQTPLLYTWGPNQGLVQYSVSTIAQDRHGYIWIGADSGASRFNGRHFETFDDRNGFVNEAVQNIIVGREGVYLLTENRELFVVRGDRAKRVETGGPVTAIVEDSDGGPPWILNDAGLSRGRREAVLQLPFSSGSATLRAPLSCRAGGKLFLASDGVVYSVSEDVIEPLHSFGERIFDLVETPGGKLGVLTATQLLGLAPDNPVSRPELLYAGSSLRCAASGCGRVVIGTTDGRLVILEDGRPRLVEEGLPRQEIMTVLIDREDNIWAGLDSGGLIQLPNALFTSYTRADGVGTGDAFYIAADMVRGGVWVGTRNGGIAHITDEGVRSFDEKDGLPSNRVRALFADSAGRIWVGTARGVFRVDPSGRRVVYRSPEDSYFQFFFEDDEGRVFSGDRRGRLMYAIGEAPLRFLEIGALPPGLEFRDMVRRGGAYFLATNGGVWKFRLRKSPGGMLIASDLEGPFCGRARVRHFFFASGDRLWAVSPAQGAWMLDEHGWKHFGEAAGFDRQVRYVIGGPDGRTWFAGNSGVWAWPDPRETRMDTTRGLRSNNIFLMAFDPLGREWIGHNLGLDLIRDGEVIAHFDNRDGLADNELNANGFAVDRQGRLWFCTMRGVSRISPDVGGRRHLPPLIHLRRVEAGHEEVPAAEGLGGGLQAIRLPSDRNSLRFEFSGQSFIDPRGLRYSWRLEGYEDEWSRPTETEWAYYPKLPPGRYTFSVRCFLENEAPSDPASVRLEIVPALWQRLSFRIGMAFLLLGGLYGVLIMRNRRVMARNAELEEIVAERTRNLAEANEALRRMAITDPLTGLFNRRFFEEEIPGELAAALRVFAGNGDERGPFRRNSSLAVFMLDLDHFKKVNDTWGHDAGDLVLREIADVISGVIRSSDTLFRWGGEEFLLLARNADPESTRILPERIRGAVEEHRCFWEGREITMTVSIGWVLYPFFSKRPGLFGWPELVHLADQALYLAKAGGRNRTIGIVEGEPPPRPGGIPEILFEDVEAAAREGLVRLISGNGSDGGG